MSYRIVREKLLYVIGIPRKYASDEILRSKQFFGQYGQADRIVINYNPKDVYEGQVAVYVHYSTPVNVAIALKVSIILQTGSIKSTNLVQYTDLSLYFWSVLKRATNESWQYLEVLVWHE